MRPERPLRATIATRIFAPEGSAAAYRLTNLHAALQVQGMEVTVLTTRSSGARRSEGAIRRWPVLRDRSGAVRGYVQYASFDVPLFFRLLFSARPDVVVAEPPPTTGLVTRIACLIRRIPYVYYSADVTSAALRGVKVNRVVKRVVTGMEKWVLDGASAVLAVSEGVRRELEELGTEPEKVSMVGTGIDTAQFSRFGSVEKPGFSYFIYAGTMSEFQGAEVFVDAFARVAADNPQVRLVMFGGGTALENLRSRGSGLADRLMFPGFVSAEIAARWMRGAVAGLASVRPGQGYDFAVPTKTFASVACATPVIFAGVGPLRHIVEDHGLGWSVDWDVDQVEAAMRSALATPLRLGEATSAWLDQDFSLKAVASRAAAVISGIVTPRC